MKQFNLITTCIVSAMMLLSIQTNAQLTTPEGSQRAQVMQRVGITNITIDYGRPSVKEREIWGKLVPYGYNDLGFGTSKAAPWRAGANSNSTITFTHDVKIEGKDIKAGTYGLHIALKEDGGATVIFSNNATAWGSYFYDEKEDALRVDVTTKEAMHTELLTFLFPEVQANSTIASLRWEKKEISFKIEVEVGGIVIDEIKKDLQGNVGFTQTNWDNAANYAFNAGEVDQALEWVNTSISGSFFSKETFANLSLKSRILVKQGKTEDAMSFVDKAVKLGNTIEVYHLGTSLIKLGQKEKALSILKDNVKNNKGAWPSNYGLAKAYSATGDYKNAIKTINTSLGNTPDGLKGRLNGDLEKLKNGKDIN
jgi:tetratricopeptide (TPR) repeat protein